jgi:hypothetical protein
MNSKHTIPLSEFSRGQWADEPPEPPHHPAELSLAARVRSGFSRLGPLAGRVQSWLGAPEARNRVWSSLTALAPLIFARYLIVFFIGVVVTVAWQSSGNGTKEEALAAAPVTLDSVRQSIDKLATEITRIRAVQQDILERISMPPPQPAATPARNPAQRPPSVR